MSRPALKRKLRCAVYTRKSSEEGLEQEFNSLDAQRAAGEAYVASQSHEGWLLVPDRYDDGGISGATLERPAPTMRADQRLDQGLIAARLWRRHRTGLVFAEQPVDFEPFFTAWAQRNRAPTS